MRHLASFIFALVVGYSGISSSHAAVELTQLYQGRVVVNSQNTVEREQALQAALRATLQKVTGDSDMLAHPAVSSALDNVRDYIVQYGYQQEQQLFLWVQFDQERIDQLIQRAGSGVWSNLRPQLLFWIVAENEQLQRELLGSADESVFMQQLRNGAQVRGMPILLPLLDLNDSMSIDVVDVWGRFPEPIQFASARYSPDGIVVARIYQNDPMVSEQKWSIDWTLDLGELRWRGAVAGMDRSLLAVDLIADITQQLAQRYRIDAQVETLNRWQIEVQGLKSLEDSIAAEQLLATLPAVQRVQLVAFGQEKAVFELEIQTAPSRLMQAIDLSKQLRPIGVSDNTAPQRPSYRWIGQ